MSNTELRQPLQHPSVANAWRTGSGVLLDRRENGEIMSCSIRSYMLLRRLPVRTVETDALSTLCRVRQPHPDWSSKPPSNKNGLLTLTILFSHINHRFLLLFSLILSPTHTLSMFPLSRKGDVVAPCTLLCLGLWYDLRRCTLCAMHVTVWLMLFW